MSLLRHYDRDAIIRLPYIISYYTAHNNIIGAGDGGLLQYSGTIFIFIRLSLV